MRHPPTKTRLRLLPNKSRILASAVKLVDVRLQIHEDDPEGIA